MPLIGPDQVRASVPTACVGLLQNAAEMPRTPAYDLFHFMSGHDEWDVRLHTDHTFGGVREPNRLSALVVGYNALHLSPEVRAAFEADPPASNLVVLHQLKPGCHDFLRGDLAVTCVPLPDRPSECAWVPAERRVSRKVEPLLHWPCAVLSGSDADVVHARALNHLAFEPGSAWRVVLEAQVDTPAGRRRLPVLIRTADFVPQRIVVTTLLLEAARHAALLENLIAYAAHGRPEVAVLAPKTRDPSYDAERIAQRLRLQGARVICVEVEDEGADVALAGWPLAGVDRIVVPPSIEDEHLLATDDGRAWLRGGGSLARVEPGSALSLRMGVTDLRWVVRRWAIWFTSTPRDTWQGKLFGTRAVLAMLETLRHFEIEGDELGVDVRAASLEGPVAALLRARVHRGSAEGTIGATVAAWDLHRQLDCRGLPPREATATRQWLLARLAEVDLSPEDRLDIARALGDADALRDAIASAPQGRSATLAVRLRQAALAWPQDAGPLPSVDHALARMDSADLRRELAAAPLLSAELVTAVHRCEAELPAGHALRPRPPAYDDAVEAMGALRGLAGTQDLTGAEAHAVSVEGAALVWYLATGEQVSAFQVRQDARSVPIKTVEAVLGETRRARECEDASRRQLAALGTAVHLLGAMAITAAVFAILAVTDVAAPDAAEAWLVYPGVVVAAVLIGLVRWRLLAHVDEPALRLAQSIVGALVLLLVVGLASVAIDRLDGALAALAVVAIVTGIAGSIAAVLDRYRLNPPWMAELLSIISEPTGLLKWVGRRLGRDQAAS